jgi:hypothetical protein
VADATAWGVASLNHLSAMIVVVVGVAYLDAVQLRRIVLLR